MTKRFVRRTVRSGSFAPRSATGGITGVLPPTHSAGDYRNDVKRFENRQTLYHLFNPRFQFFSFTALSVLYVCLCLHSCASLQLRGDTHTHTHKPVEFHSMQFSIAKKKIRFTRTDHMVPPSGVGSGCCSASSRLHCVNTDRIVRSPGSRAHRWWHHGRSPSILDVYLYWRTRVLL